MDLRKHQIECINNIKLHFENENSALIKMFCGSGKSFVIYHCLLEYMKNLSVVVVPSINLITQFLNDYLLDETKKEYNTKNFNKKFDLLTVCSKNELNNTINFTTNEDKILEFLEKDSPKIILITYQSLELLINIIIENEFKIDILCFDEAHHILGDNIKKILFENKIETEESEYTDSDNEEESCSSYYEESYYETNNFINAFCNKTLYFTAPPKNSNGIMMYESITNFDKYELIEDDESVIKDEPD